LIPKTPSDEVFRSTEIVAVAIEVEPERGDVIAERVIGTIAFTISALAGTRAADSPAPFHRLVSLADIIVRIGQFAGALEPSERGSVLGPQLVHLVILVLIRIGHSDDLRRDGVLERCVEADIMEMLDRMQTGRFKVFKHPNRLV
jgi:hypothetical protein